MIRIARKGLAMAIFLILSNCTIETCPMHEPIYPEPNDEVVYQLEAKSSIGIRNIRLYVSAQRYDASGNLQGEGEVLVREWKLCNIPKSIIIADTQPPYGRYARVSYRFEVRNILGTKRHHTVSFVTDPYPFVDHPAPIYIQGDINYVFDIIFIPDTDILEQDTFKYYCRRMIKEAFFAEPAIRHWSKQFNFYINGHAATATGYLATQAVNADYHNAPSNMNNLTFADARVIMHDRVLYDYAYGGNDGILSTEQRYLGTMMHEMGHTIFELSDEYDYGGWHEELAILPNNWCTEDGAKRDATKRHKTADDVRQIDTDWYKICGSHCQMKNSDPYLTGYDEPCTDRVVYCIKDNAGIEQ